MAATRSASSCAGIPPARRTSPNTLPTPRCGWATTACAAQYDTVAFGDSPARQAYFGSDRAQIAARSAQAGLLQCGVPLLIAAAELDPPEFRQQAERLGVPHYLLAGHSHISEILAVNTGDTTLSGLMQAFAAQHA